MEGDLLTYRISTFILAISIHALRMEGDISWEKDCRLSKRFLSTPSAWRATFLPINRIVLNFRFLSTPSAWRATAQWFYNKSLEYISIHALRMEGDYKRLRTT